MAVRSERNASGEVVGKWLSGRDLQALFDSFDERGRPSDGMESLMGPEYRKQKKPRIVWEPNSQKRG